MRGMASDVYIKNDYIKDKGCGDFIPSTHLTVENGGPYEAQHVPQTSMPQTQNMVCGGVLG